ncbi:MAG: GNAT family N-acetyltransferase [Bacteroidota bacterium]
MELEFSIEKNLEVLLELNETVHSKHCKIHPDVFAPYDKERFRPWFEVFLNKQQTSCVFVKLDGIYIGYALLIHKKRKPNNPFLHSTYEVLHVDQMSIKAAYQNQGIGEQLIDFIRQLAVQKGIPKIQLDVWNDNAQAKHFYAKKGFQTIREIMEIRIDPEEEDASLSGH